MALGGHFFGRKIVVAGLAVFGGKKGGFWFRSFGNTDLTFQNPSCKFQPRSTLSSHKTTFTFFFWKKTVSRHFSIPICLQEKESLNRRNSRKIWLIFVVLRYININSWTWKVFEMNFKYKIINPNYILLLIGGQPRRMYETFICIHQGEWFKGSRRWPILHPWQENG